MVQFSSTYISASRIAEAAGSEERTIAVRDSVGWKLEQHRYFLERQNELEAGKEGMAERALRLTRRNGLNLAIGRESLQNFMSTVLNQRAHALPHRKGQHVGWSRAGLNKLLHVL